MSPSAAARGLSRLRATAVAAVIGVALTGTSAAQEPSGLSARGTISAAVTFSGINLPIGGQIALYRRGPAYRLDILSIGLPGADPSISALTTQFLAPGGLTLLFDAQSNRYTVLSLGTKRYFTGSRSPQAPRGSAPPSVSAPIGDPFAGFGTIVRTLGSYQSFSLTTTLLGHATVDAHPATRIDLNLQDQRVGGNPETLHVQLALADDLDGFPVQIAASRSASGNGEVTGSARIDIVGIDRSSPPPQTFTVPPGFTQVNDLPSVFRPI